MNSSFENLNESSIIVPSRKRNQIIESDSDTESSFTVPQQKSNGIIESDSESSSDLVSNSSDSFVGSFVEDSFEGGEEPPQTAESDEEQANLVPHDLSEEDIVDVTEDEDQCPKSQGTSTAESDVDESIELPEVHSDKTNESLSMRTSKDPSVNRTNDESVEIINKSLSTVDLSSDDEAAPPLKQTTLKSFLTIEPASTGPTIKVSCAEYQTQVSKVTAIKADLLKVTNAMKVIKLENLPDQGKSLLDKQKTLNIMLDEQRRKLSLMVVEKQEPVAARDKIEVAWGDIQAGVNAVAPRTQGQKVVAKFNAEKQLAVETLDHLHKSLDTCPTENDHMEDPKGLKVSLMPHQKRALAWLLWREKQNPSGGILADDMGLGKTLTLITVILKSRELNLDDLAKGNSRDKYPGGTLVVCPASLINQWSGEIDSKTKRGLLSVQVHHGTKRESRAKRLAEHDVVITTYGLVLSESDKGGPVFGVRWRRVILDESHQIRNFKSQTAEAVFRLSAKSRWALTGTPVHNKELDMYAYLKFLRCSPFDDLQVWKRWMADKSTGGEMRLHAVISSLMLRRTKAELMQNGALKSLPERTWELISVKLDKNEMDVYQKVLIFSRTLFAQFLHQRAEKTQDAMDLRFNMAPPDPNGEYFKLRNKLLRLNKVKEVSQHEILVLLLRLRQICCHPCLIKQMLQGDEDLGEAENPEESEELNLLDQLNKLNIDEDDQVATGLSTENVPLREASRGYLHSSNPVFSENHLSSKIKALIGLLQKKIRAGDKVIVVSQWTSLLDIISLQLKNQGITFDCLNGKVQVNKRMEIVDNFNNPTSDVRVLLLSLTAGGVGLNLVGANHLFLLDLHWNPQLESQAQDRIYRMGQKKPIFVYKFMAVDTIEERIKYLQDKKLDIANSMLTGSKRVSDNKLSLQDLKLLFDFK